MRIYVHSHPLNRNPICVYRNAVGGGSKKWNWPQSPPHPLLLWHFSVHSSFSLSSSPKLTSCDGAESEYESENSASYRSKIRNWRNKGIDNFTFLQSCFLVLRILFLYSTWKSEGCRGNRSFSSEKYWKWIFWTKMFWLRRRTWDKKLLSLPLSHVQDTYLWLGNFSYKCSVVKLQEWS